MTSGCTDNPKLYSFNFPGTTIEYPRSEIIAHDSRPQVSIATVGDSYSSGEGVEPFFPNTNIPADETYYNQCHRSENSYSRLLDRDPLLPVNLVGSFACSGAKIEDLTDTWQFPSTQPPQLISLLQAGSVNTIALTIGGNDVNFADFARHCILDLDAYCNGQYTETLRKIREELPAKLDSLYGTLNSYSSDHLLILGYPQLVPIESYPFCTYITDNERLMARDVVTKLNIEIKNAVVRAGSKFIYLDATSSTSPFWGHQLCNIDSYFIPPGLPVEYSLHPNFSGQNAYKQLIETELKNQAIIP